MNSVRTIKADNDLSNNSNVLSRQCKYNKLYREDIGITGI